MIIKKIIFYFKYRNRLKALYKIIPVKYNFIFGDSSSEKIYGFWGLIFKIFNINWKGKLYRYSGNYFKGLYKYYKYYKHRKNNEKEGYGTITIRNF